MLAVVQQVLDQPRGQLALGIGPRQQLQVIGVGLVLAAVPVPPVALGQLELGRLVLVVLLTYWSMFCRIMASFSFSPCFSSARPYIALP